MLLSQRARAGARCAGQSSGLASPASSRPSSAGGLFASSWRQQPAAARGGRRSSNAASPSIRPAAVPSSDQAALQQQLQQQQPLMLQRRGALPDSRLFSSIKACRTWVDCQQLLALNAHSLDAMLLSTLVTQTVAVTVSQPPPPASSGVAAPGTCQLQQQLDSASANASTSGSKARGRPRARDAAGLARYMRQLADAALRGVGGFRPQQFSNVLWGLARCGYRPQAGWLDQFLEQVGAFSTAAETIGGSAATCTRQLLLAAPAMPAACASLTRPLPRLSHARLVVHANRQSCGWWPSSRATWRSCCGRWLPCARCRRPALQPAGSQRRQTAWPPSSPLTWPMRCGRALCCACSRRRTGWALQHAQRRASGGASSRAS